MYILGGSDNGSDTAESSKGLSLHALCLDTLQWSHPPISGADPFPRSGHGSALVGVQTLAVFGGKRSDSCYLNDLVLIDLETMTGNERWSV